jgi:hypothetical protein
VPETFEQDTPYDTDFDYIADRYISFTGITATPDHLEASIDPFDLEGFVPRHDVVYRLKPDVARESGLKCAWTFGRDAKDVMAPDGRAMEFPKEVKCCSVSMIRGRWCLCIRGRRRVCRIDVAGCM